MAANLTTRPVVVIPRHVWDAVNNAIHTSTIDGRERPISLCYVAVRAAIAAYILAEAAPPQPLRETADPIGIPCSRCNAQVGQRCSDWIIGVYEYTFHNERISATKEVEVA